MTAISKTWVTIADTAVDPDSPIDTTLITGFRDNLVYLREWLGASYTAGAAQDHNHDGTNSAAVQVGANSLRNGSFEAQLAGWSLTDYAGGSHAINTANAQDGVNCLAITSTVLANGGGYAQTSEYEAVTAGRQYSVIGNISASVANIASKIEFVWFDSTKAQISISIAYSTANTPTAPTDYVTAPVAAPTNAKFKQLRITGGVPAVGSATGTVYFDGLFEDAVTKLDKIELAAAGTIFANPAISTIAYGSNTSLSPVKVQEFRVPRAGVYTTRMYNYSTNPAWAWSQIYKNGAAAGTLRQSINNSGGVSSWDENIPCAEGDLLQVYVYTGSTSIAAYAGALIGEARPMFPILRTL